MLKKTSAAVKNCIVLFVDFSSIFREKSMKNHAKITKNAIVHKNREKIAFGTAFFSNKTSFLAFLGSPWVARGLLGRPGNVPKSIIFLMFSTFLLACRFRAAPGVSWDRFGSIFFDFQLVLARFLVDFFSLFCRFAVGLLRILGRFWIDYV